MIVQDNLGISKKKDICKHFEKGEEILFSAKLTKINVRKKVQERNILITSKNIFNLRDGGIVTGAMHIFNSLAYFKRKILLTKVTAIVYAKLGNEFVIHVGSEFDYRIISDRKDMIIMYILYALSLQGIDTLLFYFNDEIELHEVTTHNSQKKKGIINPPDGDKKMMTISSFEEYLKEKVKIEKEIELTTEMIIAGSSNKITINSFNLLKTLGKGGFGKVYLVEKKDTGELFALKTIRKLFIIEKRQYEQVKREKEILHEADHPFLVGLKSAFQTPDKLFFLMPFVQGGDLYVQLKRRQRFKENEVKFFVAQIMEGLGFLHSKNIIYQDLKPENVLLDNNGYIKLADFGAAKYVYQTRSYKTFIGTADYIAPEVLKKMPYDKGVDWWSLGILMVELLFGRTPFYHRDPKLTFRYILTEKPRFHPDVKISDLCKDFILKLLCKDPKKRVGCVNDNYDLREHPWMDEIDFDALLQYKLNAPIIPEVNNETDVENFNSKFTNERPKMTLLSEDMIQELKKYDKMFNGFYYDEISQKEVMMDPEDEEEMFENGGGEEGEDKLNQEEINLQVAAESFGKKPNQALENSPDEDATE